MLSFEYVNEKINLTQEVGHFFAAFPKKVKLNIPFFIPNFTLGSFGAITQVIMSTYHLMDVNLNEVLIMLYIFVHSPSLYIF